MVRIGIVGVGFMGMKRRRILGSVLKPEDFPGVSAPLEILCASDSLPTQGMAQRIQRKSGDPS